MGWLLNIILLLIWLTCIIMSLASGLWGNVIMIFNVVIAALVATNYFEPLADFLDKQMPSFTYFWDFVAMWLLFAAVCGILRAFTDALSKVKVRFKKPVELGGGLFCGAVVGWIMVCFTLFSLHASPLHPAFLGGGFNSFAPMFFGIAPDRQWGAFADGQSTGGPLASGDERFVFISRNPKDRSYVTSYLTRRATFATSTTSRVKK
jgi:hypothetical protein